MAIHWTRENTLSRSKICSNSQLPQHIRTGTLSRMQFSNLPQTQVFPTKTTESGLNPLKVSNYKTQDSARCGFLLEPKQDTQKAIQSPEMEHFMATETMIIHAL